MDVAGIGGSVDPCLSWERDLSLAYLNSLTLIFGKRGFFGCAAEHHHCPTLILPLEFRFDLYDLAWVHLLVSYAHAPGNCFKHEIVPGCVHLTHWEKAMS